LLAVVPAACVSSEVIRESHGKEYAIVELDRIHQELKRSYYDPKLRGQDMEALLREAKLAIEQSTSDQQRFKALSNFLIPLDDSHTYYIGGSPVTLHDYGFNFRFYGDRPFVSAVDSWGPAAPLQVQRGDEILSFAGRTLTRDSSYRVLVDFIGQHPIPPLNLELRRPDQTTRTVSLIADTAALRKLRGPEYRKVYAAWLDSTKRAQGHVTASIHDRVFVWKLPEFEEADLALGKVARSAGKHETVILDLRGNPGGPVGRLEEVMGFFIERPIDIGTLHMRWEEERFRSKPKRDRLTNKLIVLVDSETGSAAEVFTRLLQLEKRATVIGDRTAGAVMASMQFGYASITVSDFVLHNGERLEKKGVVPDVTIIPKPGDIAAGYDPVLAYAITSAGVSITPAQAATILAPK
jgi:C-terminal processing protease CtpA/Prc